MLCKTPRGWGNHATLQPLASDGDTFNNPHNDCHPFARIARVRYAVLCCSVVVVHVVLQHLHLLGQLLICLCLEAQLAHHALLAGQLLTTLQQAQQV